MLIRLCVLTVLVLTGTGAMVTEAQDWPLTDAALLPADIVQDGAPILGDVDAG